MRFLYFAPHPDDLEFNIPSIMFSIAHCQNLEKFADHPEIQNALRISRSYFTKNPKEQFQFKAVSMTRGEMAELTDELQSTLKAAEVRSQELINGQKILTGRTPDFLGFFDGYVKITDEAIHSVYEYILNMGPDYIIGPEPIFVYYDHQDHVNTGKILYFALKRMVDAKNQGKINKKIPKLLYYQSIYNHWWFPRFSEFEHILFEALKAHETQSFTIDKKGIEYNIGLLEKLFKGLKVGYSRKGEALRYQPIPNNPDVKGRFKVKTLHDIPFRKQFVHFLITYLRKKMASHNYTERYNKYYDGKLPASISGSWD